MKEFIGHYCYSRAGHDSGKLYVVLYENENEVFLSDGHLRKTDKPKKKKKKHIQIINRKADIIEARLREDKPITDADVVNAINVYSADMEVSTCQNQM